MLRMTEPTRPLLDPVVGPNGDLHAKSVGTPESFKIRGMITIGSRYVIPVIFVPGTMGTNLRATTNPDNEQNLVLAPGEPAWRMPNGKIDGLREATKWKKLGPDVRQKILDPSTLEVDDSGDIVIPPCSIDPDEMRKRGWGEVHSDSYGELLFSLQSYLDRTFRPDALGKRQIRGHWKRVMECDPKRWGVQSVAPLTEAELERHAHFQYPVYAVGYNWLESCAKAADRLEQRVNEIITFWAGRKHSCKQVILVTHSMGGLVARACAKRMPDKIAGIVHGVMPALGAPICYRRIACGTEPFNPSNNALENFVASKFAEIAGETSDATTPVMAVAAGVLELLPNHLYPPGWLTASSTTKSHIGDGQLDYSEHLRLPTGSPYELYRDMTSWYRLIDPALADPAEKYKKKPGGIGRIILEAITSAEWFHTKTLDTYYHPHSYAFYGNDPQHLAYGSIRWVAPRPLNVGIALTTTSIQQAKLLEHAHDGARKVKVDGKATLHFAPAQQDERGDDTVPQQSGAGPAGKVRQLFATRGYGHKGSFKSADMLLLTQYLIVKIVQEAK
jgi:pimeloyl-ACP methyl ester carboxylesterase